MQHSREFVVDFRNASSLETLAIHIGAPPHVLREVVEAQDQSIFYRMHDIPKRRKGACRRVWEALSDDLADAHRSLARRFEVFARDIQIGYPQDAATGYVPGGSTLKNARVHAGARHLLRADIADFFESISSATLERLFSRCGLSSNIARVLARFTSINGSLGLGLHTSPLLANLVCIDLDRRLSALAAKHNCSYTRYADDLAFSGPTRLPSRLELASAVAADGFCLSERKFRKTIRGQAHYVTGLSISEKEPRAPRELKRRLRQELYYCGKFGIEEHLDHVCSPTVQKGVNRIDGTIRYLNAVEVALARQHRAHWCQLLQRDGLAPAYQPRGERELVRATILVDETEIATEDGRVLALGCITTTELYKLENVAKDLVAKYIDDPFASGRKPVLRKNGLHFADAPEDLRTDFIKILPELPFRAYIAHEQLLSDAEYQKTYLKLLRVLLPRRLKALDRADVTIVLETNSKVPVAKASQVVNEVFDELVKNNDRRPAAAPKIQEGKKSTDPAISVVDFVLGVFSAFATLLQVSPQGKKQTNEELTRKRFERLRDKVRLIIALSPRETFSRRRPFTPWSRRTADSQDPEPTE